MTMVKSCENMRLVNKTTCDSYSTLKCREAFSEAVNGKSKCHNIVKENMNVPYYGAALEFYGEE